MQFRASQLSGGLDFSEFDIHNHPLSNATIVQFGPDVVLFSLEVEATVTGFTLIEARKQTHDTRGVAAKDICLVLSQFFSFIVRLMAGTC